MSSYKYGVSRISYPVVATFSNLPNPVLFKNQTYVVLESTGIWLIDRKPKGFYYSTGGVWYYIGDHPTTLSDLTGTINTTQHGNQTDSNLHAVATTTQHGFQSASDKINLNSLVNKQKDWISLIDSQYTQNNPFICISEVENQITNNGGSVNNQIYKSSNTDWNYDTSLQKLITSELGRTFKIRVSHFIRQSINNSYFTLIFKINLNSVFENTIILPKGAGIWNYTSNTINVFVGSTNFTQNGGKIFIKPSNNIEIASTSFFIESFG